MTTGTQNPNVGNSSSATVTRSGQLRRSQTVFESSNRLKNFPILAVWTLVTNAISLGISILFIGLFWNKSCSPSLAFLFIYCFIFLINIGFGFHFHFRFTRNIELSKKKRNIILSSFIIFICISVAIFIITIFIKDLSPSCSASLSVLIRADSIIDLIFLGGLLFFNIVTMCSFSTEKRRSQNDNQVVDLEKPSDNYQSKDSINNYPLPPPPLYLMEQSVGPRGQTYSGLPPPPPIPQHTHQTNSTYNNQLQNNVDGLPPPPPYPNN